MDYGNSLAESSTGHPFIYACANGPNYTMEMGDIQHVLLPPSHFMQLVNAINGLICCVGLLGNVLVFYVICRFASMHTVTNIFILALALADVCFLVNIPFLIATTIVEQWTFGWLYCKIYYVMTTVNQFASSFFLVAMSADRYFAICLPYISRDFRTPRAAFLVCSLVWSLAILFMCPVFMYAGTRTVETAEGLETQCNIFWPDMLDLHVQGPQAFALYCFVLGFAFPVAFMVLFYSLVVHRLRTRQHHPTNLSTTRAVNKNRRAKVHKVSFMIMILVLAYLLCWTPYWVYQLNITFRLIGLSHSSSSSPHSSSLPSDLLHDDPCHEPSEHGGQQMVWWDIYTALSLQCLCYLNSAINPVLYALISDNFKQSYKKAWCFHVAIPHLRKSLFNHDRIPKTKDRLSVTYRSGNLGSNRAVNTAAEPQDAPL
ncbi:hypothetical protein RvY_18764 [Ramazzottius varieornatus]|uniref:G-protein coupled receptors family 1 profile domain-containing protein n=1 Tax=Ramazzottius varieornatus TaxID=947166 RepID=A0A1D1W6Y1_RAMVA|nr:hypothetical protein RvY_18764 [Ramazzottius varieornatus]